MRAAGPTAAGPAAAEAAATTDARRRAPCSMPHRPTASAAGADGGAAGAAAGRGPKAATRDARRDHRRLGWDGAGAARLEAPRRARDDRRLPGHARRGGRAGPPAGAVRDRRSDARAHVLARGAARPAAAGATRVDLDTLLRESDVVSVHYRLSDKTRGLITARHLALMKPGAFLVNTARGPIVDEKALLDALRARRIAGAALDVFDVEPVPKDHPFLALDNVVLTPHLGFVTAEGYGIFFGQATESILAYLDGKTPPRVVAARG